MASPLEQHDPLRLTDVERRTGQLGRELLHDARQHRTKVFSSRFWSDQFMTWAMQDPVLKVQLFRFVDVFPMLRTPEQVYDGLVEYLGQPGVKLPGWIEHGLTAGRLAKGLLAKTLAGRIASVAANFIAGADARAALPKLEKLWNQGVAFSLDLLGEACVSDEEARAYQRRDEELLKSPLAALSPPPAMERRRPAQVLGLNEGTAGDGRPFANEPQHDFSQKLQRERFAAAVRAAVVPPVDRGVTLEDAQQAVARAVAAFPAWRDLPAERRAAILVEAAARLRERRDLLSGVIIREAGKTWREADADVCEAIDFCEYYARRAVELFEPQRLGRFVGELNEVWHQPRGAAVVISPWNFPLAICAGMTTAALVTGNAVLVKPASPTPGIAQSLCEALWAAGVPRNVLGFLPGSGEIGAALVRDPRVALIAFTGSKQVGLEIIQAAGQTGETQGFVKKVVCETGGKNAILVDDSADLDEAVLGVRQSAFSYCGQKCSACSRAVVVQGVYDVFLRRLVESTRSLVIGDPLDPGTDVGPVIHQAAADKIRQYIEIGRQEGTLELACEVPAGLDQRVGKPFIGPHIFSGIQPHHRLASEEIFGPVLSVMRAADFRQALDWANASAYKLTGGVFSRQPSHLELARREFRVGNLYLNRGITGALVGRQPFGGFGLSGLGTQAGGPEYLLQFVEPRCCSENTMRHGFAPGLE